ncbi:MAG TPA: flagellar hook protein FlgE [Arenimonas sp.]|nr:flagellar hook protein FlgE [Arenimonas sp.]
MSFRIALSGLNAANTDLSITANNMANVNTTGFKLSRAEFGDVFPVSSLGLSRNATGAGVQVSAVAQQFAQGNIDFTDNSLDLAVSGTGFFTLSQNGIVSYSRAGAFGVDREGFLVNNDGKRLQAFPPNPAGVGFDTGRLADLQLSNADNPPNATSEVTVGTNLPANAAVPLTAPFDPLDPNTFNHTTSLTVFDSLGVSHVLSVYYIKTANPNEWELEGIITDIDGSTTNVTSGGAITLQYDSGGFLTTPAPPSIATLDSYTPSTGAAGFAIDLDLSESTQYGERFSVTRLVQDGFTTGRLSGLEVSPEGVVFSRFTNGQTQELGQIALATFANPQGLQNIGNTSWGETFDSGQPLRGQAGSSAFGLIQSGALEASNVDLTEQLVNMITAQRNFQANAKMITTSDQLTQSIINIR